MNQSIDQLSINTIRTLSMDAVQQANSGHPGTPMSMAPVMYGLWQRHLRYDPADPLWPNRDRFVLSIGHASMLLYSTLYLAGVRALDAKAAGAQSADADPRRFEKISPARQQDPRPSRVRPHRRCRDHHRSARPRRGQQRRYGDRVEMAWQLFQPARLRAVRFRCLRAVRRRRHDGRDQQ